MQLQNLAGLMLAANERLKIRLGGHLSIGKFDVANFLCHNSVCVNCASKQENASKRNLGNPLFIEVSEIYREVPGGFEPPWTVLQTVD